MLIDVHAHFYTERCGRSDWAALNAARLRAGERIGITAHVASILGTWGRTSPTYFPSRPDIEHANTAMLDLQRSYEGLVYGYCVVNPNFTEHALGEISRCLDAGMIGVKLAASRRADDALVDPIALAAADRGVPILHHVWHDRRQDWPGQEASDVAELATLASRHPEVSFIVAHLGGGGDWAHTLRVVRETPNLWIDISGSGSDLDMMHRAVEVVGVERMMFGTDLTMCTGWGKLRYLEQMDLSRSDLARVRAENAQEIFPDGSFA